MRPGPSRERVAQPPRKLGEGRLVEREAETASRDRAWDEAGHPLWSQVSEKCAVLGSSAAWFSKSVDPWVAAALRGSTGLTSDRIHLWFLPQSSERPSENLTRTRMATSTVGTWATACVPWATCPPRWSLLSCPNRST